MAKLTRKPVGRSGILLWERDPHPEITVDMIVDGRAPGFIPQSLDFEVLELLLRYNFMTARQSSLALQVRDGNTEVPTHVARKVARHLQALHEVGLADRAWGRYRLKTPILQMSGDPVMARHNWVSEWIYALSSKGFTVLVRSANEWAVSWRDDWTARADTVSRKNSVEHELGRNDVALAILQAAALRDRPCPEWLGPRESYHRVAPPTPGAPWQHIEPDSVITLDTGRPLFLEYERSGRADKFLRKVRAMRMYLASGAWKERYVLSPWVVYAIPSATRSDQRFAGSFGDLAAQTRTAGTARYLLLDELAWEGGAWEATDARGQYVDFWNTVWSAT